MLRHRKLCALVLALATAGVAHATQSLKVTLAEPSDAPADQTGKIQVTLTNDGDEPIDILKPLTPFAQGPANGLAGGIFNVKDAQGRRVAYWGDSGKYVGFTASDFIHLLPGQSLSKTVDLAPVYELSSGSYTISYDLDYSMKRPEKGQVVKEADSTTRKHSVSNTLQIQVNGSLLKANPQAAIGFPKAPLTPQ
jgi:hypothetical protein